MTSEFVVAVHALVFLNHKGKSMISEEIAENVCTNPARIRKVMAKLKKAGLIETREGAAKGGYRFVKKSDEVTLLDILDALDERIVSMSWRTGNPDMECLIASGMADVMDSILLRMNTGCQDILKQITVYDIDRQIFQKEGKTHEKI